MKAQKTRKAAQSNANASANTETKAGDNAETPKENAYGYSNNPCGPCGSGRKSDELAALQANMPLASSVDFRSLLGSPNSTCTYPGMLVGFHSHH